MKSGIYTIVNKRSKKLYVGRSRNVHRRLKEHKRNLERNTHCNGYLQSAYNLEPDNFEFEVLELCDEEYLVSFEQYWLNMTQADDRKYGYCLDHCAYNGTIGKLSSETKDKLRLAHLGKKLTKEVIEKIRLKNLGQSRPIQAEKMRENWGLVKHKMGFNNLSKEKQTSVRRKLSVSTTKRYSNPDNLPKTQKLVFINQNGVITEFKSINQAERSLGVSAGYLHHFVKSGETKYIKRFNATITIK